MKPNIYGLLPCPKCGCKDVKIGHETYSPGISLVLVMCPQCVYWGPEEHAYNRRYKEVDRVVRARWNDMVRRSHRATEAANPG